MSSLKQSYESYTSEHLLTLRARGDLLTDEAHRAIEEIFAERGETLPPRPRKPVDLSQRGRESGRGGKVLGSVVWFFLALVAVGTGKALGHTLVGALLGVAFLAFLVIQAVHSQRQSPAERAEELRQRKLKEAGLTELMACAADGDMDRVRELLAYGVKIDARSNDGGTALMYAARNNHLGVVKILLNAGADPSLKTDNGSTALDIARKGGGADIAALLAQAANR